MSRLTGLIRVAVFFAIVGRSALSDAYNQANATPNLVYELLLGGILSSSLVPLFTRLHHDDDPRGEVAVRSIALLALGGVTGLSMLLAPWIFQLYATATSQQVDATLYREVGGALAVFFLAQIFFYGLNALLGAELQARGRFFAAAWSPALSNLAIIASLLVVPALVDGKPGLDDVVSNDALRYTLGIGATAGIAVMALALLPSMMAAGAPLGFRIDVRNPAVATLRRLSGWALGYVVANQVAIIVVQNLLVRSAEGAQSAYTLAFTLFVLPHGLLAMSIVTTFLPLMSRSIAERDRPALIERSSQGLRIVALLTIPAGFGLFVLRQPLVAMVAGYGNFTADDVLAASRALAGFALGLGAFSIYLFVLRVFYAHTDARTPFVINCVENAINIVLALLLWQRYGALGVAASFAIAYAVSALWSLQVLSYKVRGFPLRATLQSFGRMVLAGVVMMEVVWVVAQVVGSNDGAGALLTVVVGGLVGVAVYAGVLWLLGAPELRQVRSALQR
jgi:putative peptidoglycan lipid II flippase